MECVRATLASHAQRDHLGTHDHPSQPAVSKHVSYTFCPARVYVNPAPHVEHGRGHDTCQPRFELGCGTCLPRALELWQSLDSQRSSVRTPGSLGCGARETAQRCFAAPLCVRPPSTHTLRRHSFHPTAGLLWQSLELCPLPGDARKSAAGQRPCTLRSFAQDAQKRAGGRRPCSMPSLEPKMAMGR